MQKTSDALHIDGYLTIKTYKNGELVREIGPFKNKVVSSEGRGRNLLARALAGDPTYSPEITSASLGNYTFPPSDADVMLGGELVDDIPITNMTVVNDVLTVDIFVADANLPDDVYEEFGLFAGTQLMTRLVISPAYTKASGEDTLFTYTLTLTG